MNTKETNEIVKNDIEKTKIDAENVNKRENRKKILKKICRVIWIILFNIIFPYLIYVISNINNPMFFLLRRLKIDAHEFFYFALLYELIIVYGFYFLFKAIFKKSLRSNIAIAVLFNLISIISFYKLQVVEKPFLPEDILLIGNAFEIAKYGNLQIEPILLLQVFLTTILLVIQGLITWYSKYEKYYKRITRIIVGTLSTIILLIACLGNWSNIEGLEEDDYDYKLNHYHYGATINFCKNLYKLVENPELDIYNIDRLNKIKEESAKLDLKNGDTEIKPNIIVIMAESFSDITEIEGLEFSAEPIENYKKLQEEGVSGKATVSIYGGETSTSEFEFLTASTTRFVPQARYPYSQAMKGDTISIVSVLKNEGYYTTSIHPNKGGFYNRENAYKHFEFDNSIFINDMENIENYYDGNVSDMDVAEEIIKQYENTPADKKFIFTITMESHMPYVSDKYSKKDVEVISNGEYNLSKEDIEEIETYTQGLYDFDKALKYLTDYFDEKEEEVMLVVFGDHLPALNSLYESAYGDNIERYQTPYLIWTNYNTEINVEKNISLAGLATRVLENANIDMPWYYDFIYEFYKEYPVFEKRFIIDKEGNVLPDDINNELIEDYNIIQFDILFEKNIKIEQ